mmetsp:Transcript_79191/g.219051  ORF Transcript_79191/g.219051 Transcript_79191/m.219051 type:complete len:263 (-) Transcript_79191:217-1005(-)
MRVCPECEPPVGLFGFRALGDDRCERPVQVNIVSQDNEVLVRPVRPHGRVEVAQRVVHPAVHVVVELGGLDDPTHALPPIHVYQGIKAIEVAVPCLQGPVVYLEAARDVGQEDVNLHAQGLDWLHNLPKVILCQPTLDGQGGIAASLLVLCEEVPGPECLAGHQQHHLAVRRRLLRRASAPLLAIQWRRHLGIRSPPPAEALKVEDTPDDRFIAKVPCQCEVVAAIITPCLWMAGAVVAHWPAAQRPLCPQRGRGLYPGSQD